MPFGIVKPTGKNGLHIYVKRQDFNVGDQVEIVRTGSLLISRELEEFIREVMRREKAGDTTPVYNDKSALGDIKRRAGQPRDYSEEDTPV